MTDAPSRINISWNPDQPDDGRLEYTTAGRFVNTNVVYVRAAANELAAAVKALCQAQEYFRKIGVLKDDECLKELAALEKLING